MRLASLRVMVLAIVCTLALGALRAGEGGDVTQAEYDQLKKELADLQRMLDSTTPVGPRSSAVDEALDNKYGPDARVSTRAGKLTIGGLLQVWYYSIQNDNRGWVDADQLGSVPGGGASWGSNEVNDNDSFRVRRSQLRFTMDITENITGVVMIDPAREATSFPTFPANVGTSGSTAPGGTLSGDGVAFTNPGVSAVGGPGGEGVLGHVRNPDVRSGGGLANRALEDAYINYHGVIPHHDFTVGQFRRRLGEEGTRDDAQLDFTERAMITQLASLRDLGIQAHGSWWDERFQYWIGGFNGAGTAFQQRQNRSNDNDALDFVGTILVRPLWLDEDWGSIELGYSYLGGLGGEGSTPGRSVASTADGLNRREVWHSMQYAWLSWQAGGPARGLWIRGEWGQYRDRFAPNELAYIPSVAGGGLTVLDPAPFTVQGWTVSAGFKLSESVWEDDVPGWVRPMEFVFRYDHMNNLFYPDDFNSLREIDVMGTTVVTAGINYYIKNHNAKIQLNYNWVNEEDKKDLGVGPPTRQIREVRNDNLVVNFQVGW
ncbi:MAG: OprO/OprP family phosphate-selective porin [Planctomycetota bacterium]|nr:OprO/OprP family phosphate-selective porin [Planctomycetota bacterium]